MFVADLTDSLKLLPNLQDFNLGGWVASPQTSVFAFSIDNNNHHQLLSQKALILHNHFPLGCLGGKNSWKYKNKTNL